MGRLVRGLRSPWLRGAFLVVAVTAAVVGVVRSWDEVSAALADVGAGAVLAALAVSVAYLVVTMASWRTVLVDLGVRLPGRVAAGVFFVSQVGKYVPGGVWNVVAAGELGADRQIPRRVSVTGMAVAMLVSVAAGVALGLGGLALGPDHAHGQLDMLLWVAPLAALVLWPPLLNRLVALALRLTGRQPLARGLTPGGTVRATGWAVAGWLLAGLQVWLLGTAVGMEVTPRTLALTTGAYALAWVAGFLVLFAPAGVGAREAVLLALLAGTLGTGEVLVVVLLSRVLLTAVDLVMAGVGARLLRDSAGSSA